MKTDLRYEKWMLPLSVPFGLGPRHSEVRIEDGILHMSMGWGFRTEVPLASIVTAEHYQGRITSWGAHGFRGRWLVNGSAKGVVVLTIDPPATARVAGGVRVTLKELAVSVTDPEALIAACTASA